MKKTCFSKTNVIGTTLAVVVMGVAPVLAQTPEESGNPSPENRPVSSPTSQPSVGHGDKRFLQKAAGIGAEEVGISRIAAQNANSVKVRDFARQMASAHEQANAELSELAVSKGVTLPNEDIDLKKWTTKSAKDFDEDYLEKMIDAHEDAIELFSKGAKSEDPDVAAYARKYLPILKEHYGMAKELKKAID